MFHWLHKKSDGAIVDLSDLVLEKKANYMFICELAIDKAIEMITKMIAKSEIKVYRKNDDDRVAEIKNNLYYRLNVRPNDFQTGTDFWKLVIKKLLKEGECLIIADAFSYSGNDAKLYVADSFTESDEVLYPRRYTNVSVENYPFRKTFDADHVLHLKNRNRKIIAYMNQFNKAYGDLLATAVQSYKASNASKYKMEMQGGSYQLKTQDGKVISTNEYTRNIAEKIASEELEVIISSPQTKLDKIETGNSKSTDDLRTITSHIFETVAFVFDIPIDVFMGKTTEKSNAMNDFITFAVSDIAEIINDSLNAKWVTKEEYLRGEKIELDQSSFKHVDILDVATNLDKLYSNGFSHNDLRGFVGLPLLDEDWANEHNVTKNYAPIKEGGGGNEEIL